ncbi:MAG: hypothetical protein H7844_11665 [Nitrospirae bacterium YQR-1]
MKRSLVYVLLLALVLTGVGIYGAGKVDAASYVRYFLPYLHTNTNNVVYCVVSNNGGMFDNVTTATFRVAANSAGTATSTTGETPSQNPAATYRNFDYKKTSQISFTGQAIYVGTSTTAPWDLSNVTDTSGGYSGELTFVSTLVGSTGTTTGDKVASLLNCKKLGMACFQGTTSPKRNLVGYTCEAGTYDGTTFRVYKSISIVSSFSPTSTTGGTGFASGASVVSWVPGGVNVDGSAPSSGMDNATDLSY